MDVLNSLLPVGRSIPNLHCRHSVQGPVDRCIREIVGTVFVFFLGVFLLIQSGALASAQALNPGDVLSITVYQDPKLDRQVVIGPTGMISFPLAGQIKAGGMTPAALESVLKTKLKDKFTTDLDVNVTLVASKPETKDAREDEKKPRFFVTGEVLKPGAFVLGDKMNVLQAISVAGGFSLFAAKSRIQVRRQVDGREMMYMFDYEAFHSGRNVAGNIELEAGDVIIIPEKGIFD